MGSSLGRIALGVVGAIIGAPFGLAAVGFAIGSAIGGFIFAPEGPNVEGPRLGDTDVTASSLGKTIAQHFGVTRAAGNVIWSGGLKEIKKTEEQGGGGKGGGGGGGTVTTYSYFASFASVFGKAPAENVLRMWADGKLIYDATGVGNTQNGKYKFRFKSGGTNQGIDPLIAESINRRLAGLPDVNEGNGPQSDFRTMQDLINEVNASTDPRSAIYSTYLTQLKNDAEAGGAAIPDYMFTPAYKEMCMIVFDDMPLEDFGNRIPNITAEIVWTATTTLDPNDTVYETAVSEISADTTVPVSGVGVAPSSETLLTLGTTRMRKFSAVSAAEVLDAAITQTQTAQPEDPGQSPKSVTATVQEIIGANANDDYIVRLSRTGETSTPILGIVTNTSLNIQGYGGGSGWYAFNTPQMDSGAASCTYGSSAGVNGSRNLFAGVNPSGNFYLFDTNTSVVVAWGVGSTTFQGIGEGPMCKGAGSAGETDVFWLASGGGSWKLYKVNIKFGTSGTPTVSFTTMRTQTLGGDTISTVSYNYATNSVSVMIKKSTGGGELYTFDPSAAGTTADPFLQNTSDLTLAPPNPKSGMQRSNVAAGTLGYAAGNDAAVVNLATGEEVVYTGVVSGNASQDVQVFTSTSGSVFLWVDDEPKRLQFNRLATSLYSTDLAAIIGTICERTGMTGDEYDVSELEEKFSVRGYTIARPSNGRKALENLLLAYFVDGIESDWEVKFKERNTAPVRTINEDELGAVSSPTGDVQWLEMRQPEYDLPSEINMNFTDIDRDYQTGTAHKRRISQPSPVMYSRKTQNIEMPIVMQETEARDVAERLLYLTWMSRDQAKGRLPWTHADLDPTDVISIALKDGRTLTDRIAKATMGANFEIEIETARSGDPVYESAAQAEIGSSNVPGNSIITPVFSKMFVFDIPLLYDYHDVTRTALRFYTTVGADSTAFLSADLYQSPDNVNFATFDTATVDATWGQVVGDPLGAPRSLFTTDNDNTLTVRLSIDNGDVVSVTQDQILNSEANRALIWDQNSGVGEIIQYQNATLNPDGTYTLDTLVRGRRGTDYAVGDHVEGEFFVLLSDAYISPQTNPLAVVGSTQYFKAVSRGSLLGSTIGVNNTFVGRDLKPYAPSNVRREDDGTDLTVTWNRRTRIGGEWNQFGSGVETVPLNEDSEAYQVYLLPNTLGALDAFDPLEPSTFLEQRTVGVESEVFLGADLSTYGYTLNDTINVAVFQMSAQVGRGFPSLAGLAP